MSTAIREGVIDDFIHTYPRPRQRVSILLTQSIAPRKEGRHGPPSWIKTLVLMLTRVVPASVCSIPASRRVNVPHRIAIESGEA